MLKCFVKSIDGKPVETIEFEIERTYPNSDGASIFDQQRLIPNYDPTCFYTISCGDILYDIDCVGWSVLTASQRKAQLAKATENVQEPITSLGVNDEKASHRIVGMTQKYGCGIIGYYARESLQPMLDHIRSVDPTSHVRAEPHNPNLNGKALRSTDVEWIVNDDGELGVKVGDQFFFMYKGESLMYKENEDAPTQYRAVGKREFGESGPKSPDEDFLDVGDWRQMNHAFHNNESSFTD